MRNRLGENIKWDFLPTKIGLFCLLIEDKRIRGVESIKETHFFHLIREAIPEENPFLFGHGPSRESSKFLDSVRKLFPLNSLPYKQ